MPAEPQLNSVSPDVKDRSVTSGDVPEALRRRYYLDSRGGPGLAFYVDATVKAPVFHDRGGRLVAARTDPHAIRDMMAIARHRQWTVVTVRGAADFRREAWLAGRSAGLEVRGYRPTERDVQDLERRTFKRDRAQDEVAGRDRSPPPIHDLGGKSRMAAVSAVVRGRVDDRTAQERILAAARARIADWLERGARFDVFPAAREARREKTLVRDR
jgi:hypothetical protein